MMEAENIDLSTADIAQIPDDVIIMENQCTIDKQTYYEAVIAQSKTKKNLVLFILSMLMIPLGYVMGSTAIMVIALVIFVLVVCMRPIAGWRDYRILRKVHPEGIWTKTVRFYRDHIETDSGTGECTLAYYEKLCCIRETKRLCILDFGRAYPASILDKNGFQKGSMDELRMLISQLEDAEANRRAEASLKKNG